MSLASRTCVSSNNSALAFPLHFEMAALILMKMTLALGATHPLANSPYLLSLVAKSTTLTSQSLSAQLLISATLSKPVLDTSVWIWRTVSRRR